MFQKTAEQVTGLCELAYNGPVHRKSGVLGYLIEGVCDVSWIQNPPPTPTAASHILLLSPSPPPVSFLYRDESQR